MLDLFSPRPHNTQAAIQPSCPCMRLSVWPHLAWGHGVPFHFLFQYRSVPAMKCNEMQCNAMK